MISEYTGSGSGIDQIVQSDSLFSYELSAASSTPLPGWINDTERFSIDTDGVIRLKSVVTGAEDFVLEVVVTNLLGYSIYATFTITISTTTTTGTTATTTSTSVDQESDPLYFLLMGVGLGCTWFENS